MTLAMVFGASIGIVLGLTGAGGGILAVPALVLGLGWSMTQAAPVALLAVGSAAALGAFDGLRKGLVRYRAAALMAILGIALSPVGVYLAHRLPEKTLMTLFAVVMVIAALRMLTQARQPVRNEPEPCAAKGKNCMIDPSTGRLQWNLRCSGTLAAIGAVSGLLTGLLGVGGGFLIVPAFRQFSNLRIHSIVATSLMVIALVSLGAVVSALHAGLSIAPTGRVFIAATLLGMLAGRMIAPRLSPRLLLGSFATVCLLVALYLLGHTWF